MGKRMMVKNDEGREETKTVYNRAPRNEEACIYNTSLHPNQKDTHLFFFSFFDPRFMYIWPHFTELDTVQYAHKRYAATFAELTVVPAMA